MSNDVTPPQSSLDILNHAQCGLTFEVSWKGKNYLNIITLIYNYLFIQMHGELDRGLRHP